MNNDNIDIYTLTDEEGNEEQFRYLEQCTYEGNTYYAMASLEQAQDEFCIFRVEGEGDDRILYTVDDDDEFDAVADIFEDQFFSDIDYDEEESDEE